ncbi:MAG: DUF2029 domain-containing protein [Xanthomonadales bacterium]|nr:DUF2029 domain-containing protein [Xanthomonadales bacterium]MCB1613020.1 DUF2029 domain-containing protein [Xanthomonadales bacterium]
MTTTMQSRLVLVLAIFLALAASAYLVRGIQFASSERGSFDLSTRGLEYRLYSVGVYPNQIIASNALPGEMLPNSVYPPYAFPMLAPVFAWEPTVPAALIFGLLTFAALWAIGVMGYLDLRFLGWQAGILGAMSGLAIAHNSSAVAFGQFSIISMGLVVAQMLCLRRGQVLAAGLCWALAMIKPQIGLAFALPFLVDRNWRGLALGLGILAVLSAWACTQTHVSPLAVLDYWLRFAELDFISAGDSQGSSAGGVLAVSGLDPRAAVSISLVAAMALTIWIWRRGGGQSPMILLALCAILGRVFMPHRAYDNIMLFPALIALLAITLQRRSAACYAVAAVFGASVWLPMTSLVRSAWLEAALLWFWLVAAVFLITQPPGLHGNRRLH